MLSGEDKQFIRQHLFDDVSQLALQSSSFADLGLNFPLILKQIAGRQQIKHKIPSWYTNEDLIYPSRLSLEQSSSEQTAKYKADLLSGDSFVDLTGGFGVDTAFIARNFRQASYVEKQKELAEIVRNNFAVLGLTSVEICPMNGIDYLQQMNPVDCLYVDPARRSNTGKKVMLIEDCEPDLVTIQDRLLEKAGQVLIKLSPMLDIKSALKTLKNTTAVHVVSVDNECKELLFLLEKNVSEEPLITCVNLRKNGESQALSFTFSEEKQTLIPFAGEVKNYLYEPNSSLLKAGFYKGIALRYCVEKLHPDSHLYTSSELIPHFPGRIFKVETVSSANKKELKKMLQDMNKANITVRNFPWSVEELRKQLKLKDGGNLYLFASTLANGKPVVIRATTDC